MSVLRSVKLLIILAGWYAVMRVRATSNRLASA